MRYFLTLAIGLALTSCAAQHQLTPQRPPKSDVVGLLSTPTTAGATASTAPFEAAPGYLAPPLGFDVKGKTKAQSQNKAARILRRWHRRFQRAALRTQTAPAAMPKKCKGCTIVYGDATVAGKKATVAAGQGASTVVAGKKAGPVVRADSGAVVQVATTKKGPAAAAGQDATAASPGASKRSLGEVLAANLSSPVGYAFGAVVLLVALAYGGPWLLGVFRRKSANNQA